MKKFLGIIVIAGALVACNNSGDSTTSADSPATTPVDSPAVSVPVVDSPATAVDSPATSSGDTTKH